MASARPTRCRSRLDLQVVATGPHPGEQEFATWVSAAVEAAGHGADVVELTIRIVEDAESAALNQRYRGRPGSTNVLSFPFDAPPGAPDSDLLGDLVICAPVVVRESAEQGKSAVAHWAHMVVHGTLHLLGFDHEEDAQAADMEALETRILTGLGFSAPYEPAIGFDDQRPSA